MGSCPYIHSYVEIVILVEKKISYTFNYSYASKILAEYSRLLVNKKSPM